MTRYDYAIIIVGAGPAGSAAAIHLTNLQPRLAERILVLDKATFPRPKLCGGGVTAYADAVLARLGMRLDVPAVIVQQCQCIFLDTSFRLPIGFRVVRREEFDGALFSAACARGIVAHTGEAVTDVRLEADAVTVYTPKAQYRAQILIGADGAHSLTARRLGLARTDHLARLLETLTPAEAQRAPEFVEHMAVFDFTPLAHGVQGYVWGFPSLLQGVPTMNRGIFDARLRPHRPQMPLKAVFAQCLAARGIRLEQCSLRGHPERWFVMADKHSVPRVLLAGDAAGADPFLGEGIAYALAFGLLAAQTALDALRSNDFSFRDYEQRIRISDFGHALRWKRVVARHFIATGRLPNWLHVCHHVNARILPHNAGQAWEP